MYKFSNFLKKLLVKTYQLAIGAMLFTTEEIADTALILVHWHYTA